MDISKLIVDKSNNGDNPPLKIGGVDYNSSSWIDYIINKREISGGDEYDYKCKFVNNEQIVCSLVESALNVSNINLFEAAIENIQKAIKTADITYMSRNDVPLLSIKYGDLTAIKGHITISAIKKMIDTLKKICLTISGINIPELPNLHIENNDKFISTEDNEELLKREKQLAKNAHELEKYIHNIIKVIEKISRRINKLYK